MKKTDSHFVELVPLCQSVVVQQAEKLANIEEYLSRYGYVAPAIRSAESVADSHTPGLCVPCRAFLCHVQFSVTRDKKLSCKLSDQFHGARNRKVHTFVTETSSASNCAESEPREDTAEITEEKRRVDDPSPAKENKLPPEM